MQLENFIATAEDLPTTIVTAATTAISTFRSNQELIETYKTSLYNYFGLSEDDATTTEEATTTNIETTTSSSTTLTALFILVALTSSMLSFY